MLSNYNKKAHRSKSLLLAFGLLFLAFGTQAQIYVTTSQLSGTAIAPGQYYNNSSIVLGPTTTITPGAGQSVTLYVVNPDCVPLATALSANQNYILTSTPRTGGIITTEGLANRNTCDLMQTVQYFDGLGRPLQTVQVKGTLTVKDIVQPIAYDQFGREAQKYLPYALTTGTSDGSYKTDALTTNAGQDQFYKSPPTGVSIVPYPSASTGFEASPLNRVLEQGAPGQPWQLGSGHTVRVTYGTNSSTDVILWSVNSTSTGATGTTNYGANQLYSTTTTDENGNNSIEYKDLRPSPDTFW
jgi:hypothetical protein